MASLTARLNELKQFMGWEIEPLPLLTWVRERLSYLPDECKDATRDYYSDADFKGEYFRVERGKAALYAMRRYELFNSAYLDELQQTAEDYFKMWKVSKNDVQVQRAFHLMEFVALTVVEQDARIRASLQAAKYGLEAHDWQATLDMTLHPFKFGYVNEPEKSELEFIQRIVQKEIKHEEKFGT